MGKKEKKTKMMAKLGGLRNEAAKRATRTPQTRGTVKGRGSPPEKGKSKRKLVLARASSVNSSAFTSTGSLEKGKSLRGLLTRKDSLLTINDCKKARRRRSSVSTSAADGNGSQRRGSSERNSNKKLLVESERSDSNSSDTGMGKM